MDSKTLEQLSIAIKIVPCLTQTQYTEIMGVLKAYYGHAGRPGLVGGSTPRHGAGGSVQSPVRDSNGTSLEKVIAKVRLEKIIAKDEAGIADQNYETGILYDRNGKEILRKGGSTTGIDFESDDAILFKDNIFTHNHPGRGSFASIDIQVAMSVDLHSIRAVGGKYLYVMTKTTDEKWNIDYWNNTVAPAIKKAKDDIKTLLQPKMDTGKIDSRDFILIRQHLMWVRVSKELGLNYERRLR